MMGENPKLEDFGLKYLTDEESKERDKLHDRQRKDWGFCDADLWGLDIVIAQFILPRLIRYREMPRMGCPADTSEEQWDNILDKMIAAFRILSNENNVSRFDKGSPAIIERGLRLFTRWFGHLWD